MSQIVTVAIGSHIKLIRNGSSYTPSGGSPIIAGPSARPDISQTEWVEFSAMGNAKSTKKQDDMLVMAPIPGGGTFGLLKRITNGTINGIEADMLQISALTFELQFGANGAINPMVPSATISLTAVATTSSSTALTCASTSGVTIGSTITGTNIPSSTTVTAIGSSTTLTLSNPATATASGGTATVTTPQVPGTFVPNSSPGLIEGWWYLQTLDSYGNLLADVVVYGAGMMKTPPNMDGKESKWVLDIMFYSNPLDLGRNWLQ